MGLFDSWANAPQDLQEKCICQSAKPRSEIITDQIKTLPLHIKLVLYACIRLLDQDKKDIKVTIRDVFEEYEKLTAEVNIYCLPMGNVVNFIKELELLGFLKCAYLRKVPGRIRYIRMFEQTEIPKYACILQEDLEKNQTVKIPYS